MNSGTKRVIGGVLIACLSSSSALASGFQRGTPDTDILFEPGTAAMSWGLTYVDPKRGFESIEGERGSYGDYTESYQIPSFAVSFGGEAFACSVHYTESFAAEANYSGLPGGGLPSQVASTQSTDNADRILSLNPGADATSRTRTLEFDSNEFGSTCRASYTNDYGRFSLLGGVFFEDFNFEGSTLGQRSLNGAVAPAVSQLPPAAQFAINQAFASGTQIVLPTMVESDVESGYNTGWRIGAAYELPEIALRAQIVYRSEVEHTGIRGDADVSATDSAFTTVNGERVSVPLLDSLVSLAGGAAAQQLAGAAFTSQLSDVTSPQYLDAKFQTGIAEGTLLLASFRWTDWSTNDAVVNSIIGEDGSVVSTYQPYFWRDGYTASLGLGRAFTERVSGVVNVGYDRGVSTGAETTYTDLYTLSGGVSLKGSDWAEIRLGGLVGYWTDGDQSISDGAYFDASVGSDVVYAANATLRFTW